MARDPSALHLRLLQTGVEVASEKNSTLVMPLPVELLRFFDKAVPGGPGSLADTGEQPADTGDAEVAAAEAAIEGELPHAAVPPVPEIGAAPGTATTADPGAAAPTDQTAPVPRVAPGTEDPAEPGS
jgi:hypothetical protein